MQPISEAAAMLRNHQMTETEFYWKFKKLTRSEQAAYCRLHRIKSARTVDGTISNVMAALRSTVALLSM